MNACRARTEKCVEADTEKSKPVDEYMLPVPSILELIQVLIIGAGTSCLCAGYKLKKAGFDIQIFEASSHVGGRVKTFKDPFLSLVSTERVV